MKPAEPIVKQLAGATAFKQVRRHCTHTRKAEGTRRCLALTQRQ